MHNTFETTDTLRPEHLNIQKALRVLDTVCNRLAQGDSIPSDHLRSLMSFIGEYATLSEHNLLRGYVDSMHTILTPTYSIDKPETIQHFIKQARNLIGCLSEHILKEEAALIPHTEKMNTLCEQINSLEKIYFTPKTPPPTCCGCGGHS